MEKSETQSKARKRSPKGTPKKSPKNSPVGSPKPPHEVVQSGSKNRRCRHVFTLKDINLFSLEKRYGVSLTEDQPKNTTNIRDITYSNDANNLSFIDDSKTEHLCSVSMIDFSTGSDVRSFQYKCYWCKNFPGDGARQLGCPIRYVPNRVTKSYFSEISKEERVITGSATRDEKSEIQDRIGPKVGFLRPNNPVDKTLSKSKYKFSLVEGEHYVTDGVFCSFDCMSAYINENQTNPLYAHSKSLMIKMYRDITGQKNVAINPAPHWRQLKEYGGEKSIEDFRACFNKVKTHCHGVIKNEPVLKPIGVLYEEKINF